MSRFFCILEECFAKCPYKNDINITIHPFM